MKKIILFAVLFSSKVFAQSMWGTGYYGGMQACQTPMMASSAMNSEDDRISDLREELQGAKEELREKKSELKKAEREIGQIRTRIENSLEGDRGEFVLEHIENSRRCDEYKGVNEKRQLEGAEGNDQIEGPAVFSVRGFSSKEWKQVCDPSRAGGVLSSVCQYGAALPEPGEQRGGGSDGGAKRTSRARSSLGTRTGASSCSQSLKDYQKKYSQQMKMQNQVEALEEKVSSLNEEIKMVQQELREEAREMAKNGSSTTESGICYECMRQNNSYSMGQQSNTNWANVGANLLMGGLSMYTGYKTQKNITEQNANLGWPTQSYPTIGYGYPFLMNGLYGALGGGTSQGTFACAQGIGGTGNFNGSMGMTGMGQQMSPYMQYSMSGAYGYPYGMMGNSMGGGMYMGGYGPWGASGSMMNYGNMMGGYNNLGGMMGLGNYGLYGMTNNYGLGYGSMTGLGGLGLYGNMGLNMGIGTTSGLGLDSTYQQQLLQLQYQQQQSYYQYQQQYMQQSVQKTQAISALQSEMQSLIYRIQQIQSGYGNASYGLGSSSGGVLTGVGTTSSYLSSTPTLTFGTIPGSTSSTTTGTLSIGGR